MTPPTRCIYQVSNWYLETCRKKARKTSKNPKRTKIIAKILKIIFLQKKRNLCREVYSRPPVYQIWRIYLDLWGHDCKKLVWPTFGCKLGQSDPIVMQLKLDMSCHLLNVYTKFQIDISKHVEEKSGKRGRTDGRTDGWTLPRHNTSRFSNEKWRFLSFPNIKIVKKVEMFPWWKQRAVYPAT